jgi:hypothetical protein
VYIDAITAGRCSSRMTTEEVLHFVEDMSERFPDYTDTEILEDASEYRDDTGEVIGYNSLVGKAVIHAYKWGADSAIKMWLTN